MGSGTKTGEDTTMVTGNDDAEATMVGRSIYAQAPKIVLKHFLSYTEGTEPKRMEIPAEGVVIGRVAPADVAIGSPEISRKHCKIEIQDEWAILSDLGSTNGTLIDGTKIDRPMRLRSGTKFSLGSFEIRYERRDPREVAEEAELSHELQRAEEYVRAILPQPIAEGPVQTEWCFIPSTKLGGDAFGYQYVNEGVFTGFVLDVSGHGIGSCMHAANVANALRRRALPDVDFTDPASVAAGLNATFPMEEHNGLLFSVWYFAYELASRTLKFCAAGHHPSFLVTPDNPEPAPLWLKSPVIGMLPFGKWASGSAVMPVGAKLFVFSDGAFEIVTADGHAWSMEDLRVLLKAPAVAGVPEPQRLYQAVRAASKPGPLDDDFSVLMVTFG